MKTLILVIFVYFNSVDGNSKYGCMSLDVFNAIYKDFFSEDIVKYSKSNNISLLDAAMKKSKPIGKGSFGKVVLIDNKKPRLALKFVRPQNIIEMIALKNEIEMMKELCEEKFDENSTELISCEGKEIAAFKGCIENKDSVYILQREAYDTLKGFPIYWRYHKQPAIKRAVMMMRILEKVASLHLKGIVHSDIKPENVVVVTDAMKEFELIDLGMARKANLKFVGGTQLFYSPEYWNGMETLIPELDVYSIAISLLDLEAFFSSFISSTLKHCFKHDFIPNQKIQLTEECHKLIVDEVPKFFKNKESPKVFIDIFKKALAYNIEDRFSSAIEFLVNIIDNLYLIPGYKGYIYNLIKTYKKKKEKEDKINKKEGKNPSSTLRWEEVAISLGYDTEPPGFVEKAAKFFVCGNSNEAPKPPAWKKDMPKYLIPSLLKKYGKNVVSAKLGIDADIISPDKSQVEVQQMNDEDVARNCIPCINDDDVEAEQEGEHQKVRIEFEENQKLHNPFNVVVWADQFPSKASQVIQQQVI